ncbi:MAG: tetratricopeptide repeat protein [Candidatus Tectimicrobiota bacterium]
MFGRLVRAQYLCTRGQRLAARGAAEAAVLAYEQALTLAPRLSGLHLHYALALAELERFSEAEAAMQQALTLQPHNPVLPMFLGQIYCDQGCYDEAATCCARTLALSPDNSHALGLQALIALRRGALQLAYTQLTQAFPAHLSGAERALLWLGRSHLPSLLQQANSALQSRLLLTIESLLLPHNRTARSLSQQLLEPTAEMTAEGLGNTVLSWLDQSFLRVLMGLRRLATFLGYVGRPAQRSTQLRLLQAEQAMYLGQTALAASLYRVQAKQPPVSALVLERLAELCYLQGQFAEALDYVRDLLKQAPAAVPPDAAQSAFLGELLYHVEEYSAADSALHRAEAAGWCDYKLFYYLGLCHLRCGARRAARTAFGRALQQLHPDIVSLRLEELHRLYPSLPHAAS